MGEASTYKWILGGIFLFFLLAIFNIYDRLFMKIVRFTSFNEVPGFYYWDVVFVIFFSLVLLIIYTGKSPHATTA